MVGTLYISQSTTRGSADFTSIPFHDASIDWNREEASTMTFKSPIYLEEATRVRYNSNTKDFGGQIYKRKKGYGEDYTYDVISYLRLYHDKVTCSYNNLTSSQILKKILSLSQNDLTTAGIKNTTAIHANVKWDNTSIWDIAQQLCWLEHQAGFEVRAFVDADGTLNFGYLEENQEGYSFIQVYDYDEEYDSSDVITQYTILFEGKTVATATSSDSIIAKWGYVGEQTECPAETTTKASSTSNSKKTSTSLKDSSQISKYSISSKVVNQALSIAKAGNTPYQNLKLLYNWADKAIAYEGYNNTKYGAAGTLSKRKGNCCDNANLLIALARSVGIKARYCHAHRSGKGHVWGEYYVNGKWFTCDTGVSSTGKYWGSHSNYAGGVTHRYDKLPF